ncbi:hypothetical protein GPECTOR_3g446 [Gonium pectorale]|uniref:DNA mismatch repair protein Mlh1 C-terminal domain-containing protein n=1 Tax=Gonium pectorale TaxID=33097 RepID=A0A150H008_GONPE|nr:hypothetical protein GPECTOR_3g446 [Gonium pectorale]|eukprot:KXZ55312.1 hypothetical protein GPECTOR_3g446 [Gonium pectorale]
MNGAVSAAACHGAADAAGERRAAERRAAERRAAERRAAERRAAERELYEQRLAEYEYRLKHVVLPAMRGCLKPPRERATDGSVVQVAALERLYRVFERC